MSFLQQQPKQYYNSFILFAIKMQSEYKSVAQINNGPVLALHIQKLFAEKILDLFIVQCEKLIEAGFNLRQFGTYYKLTFDLEVQYRSMKRVFAQSDQLLKKANEGNEGWTELKMNELCSISVRTNKTLMELKSSGTLQIDIKHALIIAYLIKFYTECLPFCKEARDIKEPTKLEKIGFIKLSIPIPFIKDRSTLVRGLGFQNKSKPHRVTIFAEGINQFKEYLEQNKVDPSGYMKNQQLLDLKHFAVEMTYLGPKRLSYTGYALIDHHIPILPERLVLFVTKEIGKHIFNKLLRKLEKFNESVWAKQMKENYAQNGYFYDWITNFVNVWSQQLSMKM